MLNKRANSSLIAILVILLVIAGVIYLFWQNTLVPPAEDTDVPVEVEETVDTEVTDETPAEEEVTEEEVVVPEEEPTEEVEEVEVTEETTEE